MLQELNRFSSCLFVAPVGIRCAPPPPPGSPFLSPRKQLPLFAAPTRLLK